MMVLSVTLSALRSAFVAEEGLAAGVLAALTASSVDAYLWCAPSFVVHGTIIGGSIVALLWGSMRSTEEEHPWGS